MGHGECESEARLEPTGGGGFRHVTVQALPSPGAPHCQAPRPPRPRLRPRYVTPAWSSPVLEGEGWLGGLGTPVCPRCAQRAATRGPGAARSLEGLAGVSGAWRSVSVTRAEGSVPPPRRRLARPAKANFSRGVSTALFLPSQHASVSMSEGMAVAAPIIRALGWRGARHKRTHKRTSIVIV